MIDIGRGAPVVLISTGPDREETIVLQHPFGQRPSVAAAPGSRTAHQ